MSTDPRDTRFRTAALLRADDESSAVLIDCGPDARMQLLRAKVRHLDAVVITHEHNDHIIGLDDLRPFIFKQRSPFRIYAEPRVQASIRERFSYAFTETPYPGAPRFELLDLAPGDVVRIGNLPPIKALRVLHGNLPILGFRIANLAYLTDVKSLPQSTLDALHDLDHLFLSMLQEKQHHSHLSLAEATAVAKTIGAKQTRFIHMSHLLGLQAEVSARLEDRFSLGWDGLAVGVDGFLR